MAKWWPYSKDQRQDNVNGQEWARVLSLKEQERDPASPCSVKADGYSAPMSFSGHVDKRRKGSHHCALPRCFKWGHCTCYCRRARLWTPINTVWTRNGKPWKLGTNGNPDTRPLWPSGTKISWLNVLLRMWVSNNRQNHEVTDSSFWTTWRPLENYS